MKTYKATIRSMSVKTRAVLSNGTGVIVINNCSSFRRRDTCRFTDVRTADGTQSRLTHKQRPRSVSHPTTSAQSKFVRSRNTKVRVLVSTRLTLRVKYPVCKVITLSGATVSGVNQSIPTPKQKVLAATGDVHDSLRGPEVLSLRCHRARLVGDLSNVGVLVGRRLSYLRSDVRDASRSRERSALRTHLASVRRRFSHQRSGRGGF